MCKEFAHLICISSEILFFLPDTGNYSCLFLDKFGQGFISLIVQLQPDVGFIDSSLGFFPSFLFSFFSLLYLLFLSAQLGYLLLF